MEKLRRILNEGWSITFACMIVGFILTIEFKQDYQRVENLNSDIITELKLQACRLPLEGQGVIITMNDSTRAERFGENPNLYIIHDEDILRVINELKAAGAEAISINGQRLIATSEIRCAGPTLSVNNVRSAPPYEISAIGDKKSLENSIKMRGGVEDTLKVWGIELAIETSDEIYIPPYDGAFKPVYAKVARERNL